MIYRRPSVVHGWALIKIPKIVLTVESPNIYTDAQSAKYACLCQVTPRCLYMVANSPHVIFLIFQVKHISANTCHFDSTQIIVSGNCRMINIRRCKETRQIFIFIVIARVYFFLLFACRQFRRSSFEPLRKDRSLTVNVFFVKVNKLQFMLCISCIKYI